MKLGRILRNSLEGAVPRLVVVQPERECVIDLATAEYQRLRHTGASEEAARHLASALYPSSMSAAIAAGPTFLVAAARTSATSVEDGSALLPFEQLRWLAPLDPPMMRDCLAFEQHLRNSFRGDLVPPQAIPQHYQMPLYYKGNPLTLIGHEQEVPWPDYTQQMDYELELGLVIGRPGKDLTPEQAKGYLFGVTIFNDFSARDIQVQEMMGLLGPAKGKDFATALGPWIESLGLYKVLNDRRGIINVTFNLAYLAQNEGNYGQARLFFEDLLAFHRTMNNRENIAEILFQLAQLRWLSHTSPPFAEIQSLIDEGLALARELGVRRTTVSHQWMLACLAFSRGDLATARSILEEIIQFARVEGFQQRLSIYQMLLARLNTAEGHYSIAQGQLEESIAIARNHNDVETMSDCLLGLAYLALAQRQYARAVRILGADEKVRETTRVSIYPVERPTYDRNVAAARVFLGEKALTALWAEGRAMSLVEALAASDVVTSSQQVAKKAPVETPAYPAGLTAREVEVLRLVAQGLSDAQVAEQLVVSPRTVTTHLTSIYNKLGVNSRVAATRFAVEHHLG